MKHYLLNNTGLEIFRKVRQIPFESIDFRCCSNKCRRILNVFFVEFLPKTFCFAKGRIFWGKNAVLSNLHQGAIVFMSIQ